MEIRSFYVCKMNRISLQSNRDNHYTYYESEKRSSSLKEKPRQNWTFSLKIPSIFQFIGVDLLSSTKSLWERTWFNPLDYFFLITRIAANFQSAMRKYIMEKQEKPRVRMCFEFKAAGLL